MTDHAPIRAYRPRPRSLAGRVGWWLLVFGAALVFGLAMINLLFDPQAI